MEVLENGSFDAYQPQSSTRTTRTPHADGQLSLECLPPEASSTKDSSFIKGTITGEQLIPSSEDKLRGMVAEMNQTLKELSGSVTDADGDANTNQGAGKDSVSEGHEIKDPALLKAISKMKRLDSKLADVTKQERKVKRQRKKLEQLLEDGVEPSSALALVQNEEDSDEENSRPSSPVFQTELRYAKKPAQTTAKENEPPKENSASTSQNHPSSKNLSKTGQDFIKRNIELVQDAGSLVAMTEEEKKRLEFLLEDEKVEDIEETNKTDCRDLILASETAFLPDGSNLERLRIIDSRLEALMPADDWRSICSNTPLSSDEAYHLELKEAVKMFHSDETAEDSEQLGETALKDSRGEQQRLKEIDVRLKHLEMSADDNENPPSLSADQLEELLQQCYKEQGIELTSNENTSLNLDEDEANDSQ
ncbi:fibrous sheath-interacting protein 1-like isoform X2 [Dysidea avara]|uniref:fibrous sheath-interacting protein 1-like isoform X2 n=1 Tax=Dysidea avara TaxID=196820 RepID=UPI003327B7D0